MLNLHHSNSLEQLNLILLQQLAKPSDSVLRPELILVQNPGMKRWLQQQISLASRVAANFEFPLPSRFIWDVFLSQFDDVEDLSAYDADVLRWRIMQLLDQQVTDKPLSVLNTYLQQDEHGLQRFQLAEKLAGLFDQYLVYRPAMIRTWEQGKANHSDVEAWQSHLWRLLRQQDPQPHRALLIQRLLKHLKHGQVNTQNLPERLFVFALSAMSPLYMNVLQALGKHLEVHIFILNPCKHYWGDILSKKELVNRNQPVLVENELLASLGKQGRDYIDQFYDDLESPEEYHYFIDKPPVSLLQRIQFDILHLGLEEVEQTFQPDKSIQVVSCYSELRELQVLHDRLLEMLEDDNELQPHDIVVMSPDVDTLAPYIEAVFGMQPEQKRIPFSISDNNELASMPLMQAVIDWVGLATSRFSASEILAWLELPALQRKYGLAAQDLEIIRHWINSTHIHWGLDQEHKRAIGLGRNNLNTWAHGIHQLLTAYLMIDEQAMLGDYPAASTLLSSAEFKSLGQLHKFLDDLAFWARRLQVPYPLIDWQLHINDLLDTFLQPDDDEEWMLKTLRDQLAAWKLQSIQGGYIEKLEPALMTQLLLQTLQQGFSHHYYLTGAINFCNLIPMRTLPFKVVCLIGMGDNHFPRKDIPLQFDLISRFPQKGDRSRREDDRYMFLQSLLSAQQNLYISYVGQNRKDDSIIEPSVVVRELLDQVKQCTGVELSIEKTALQPFSADNYLRGSYAELWQIDKPIQPVPFAQPIEARPIEADLSLHELIRFFSNSPRAFMEQRLNMSLLDYTDASEDEEPFALDPLARYQVKRALIDDLLDNGIIHQQKYLNSGALAQENNGVIQLEGQQQEAENLFHLISGHEQFSHEHVYTIDLVTDQRRLHGGIKSYSQKGLLQFSLSAKKGTSLFPYWIQHCVLCATEQSSFTELFFKQEKVSFKHLGREQAIKHVTDFIHLFDQGLNQIIPLYLDTSFDYLQQKLKTDELRAKNKVMALWSGDSFQSFFEAQDPYILTSQKNGDEWPEEFFHLAEFLWIPVFTAMERD